MTAIQVGRLGGVIISAQDTSLSGLGFKHSGQNV